MDAEERAKDCVIFSLVPKISIYDGNLKPLNIFFDNGIDKSNAFLIIGIAICVITKIIDVYKRQEYGRIQRINI